MKEITRYRDSNDLPANLGIDEVASFLGVSRSTAYGMMRNSTFPSYRINSRLLVSKEDLLNWIEKQKN